jgi:hypothetical protein
MASGLGYHLIMRGELPALGRYSVAKHEVFDRYIDTTAC